MPQTATIKSLPRAFRERPPSPWRWKLFGESFLSRGLGAANRKAWSRARSGERFAGQRHPAAHRFRL